MGGFFWLPALHFSIDQTIQKDESKVKIIVQEQLEETWKEWFDGFEIIREADHSILTGDVKDTAFLHGILNKIRDLNLNLISVEKMDEK